MTFQNASANKNICHTGKSSALYRYWRLRSRRAGREERRHDGRRRSDQR